MPSFYNPWPEGGRGKTKAARRGKAHSKAGHIGWSYRSDRKKGPKSPMRYLSAGGLTRSALKKYRSARKTKPATLLYKRTHRKRKSGRPRTSFKTRPFLVNRRGRARRNRRVGAYAMHVKRFAARTRLSGPSLMRAAAKAWRGGARRNVELPGQVTFNRKRRRTKARRNGPILPYMAFENRGRRSRRRGSRRNGPLLPYASFNPRVRATAGGALEAFTGGIETVFTPEFWTENVLPLGVGFIGAQFAGGLIQAGLEKIMGVQTGIVGSIQRIGSRALGGVALSGLALIATKDKNIATKVLAGGLVSVFAALLMEIFGRDTYAKMTGMSGIGDVAADLTEELKQKIAQSVRGEIANAEGGNSQGVSAFVTTQDIAPAPHLGPGPRVGDPGMGAFVSTQDLQTAPVAGQPPMVADLGDYSDNFADTMLV